MKKIGIIATALSAIALTGVVFLGCQPSRVRGGANQNMDNFNPTGLPIVKEKESFSLLVTEDEADPTKTMLSYYEDQTNVHLDVNAYTRSVAAERKNILVASGDYPDVMAGWLLGEGEIVRMKEDGMIIPLSDMIEKYTVNIKEVLEYPGVREIMTHPDGEIYTIPYINEGPKSGHIPWINVEWLKRLNLPMPTTTEEYKNTLIAFRDRIPPVNGQAIIPFSANPSTFGTGGILAGWFGVNAAGPVAMIDGRLENTITRPEYREYIKFFADLWANGLVDPELFSQNQQTWNAKGLQGLYGVSFAYGPSDFAQMVRTDKTVNQTDYEPLAMLRGPGVTKPVYHRASNGYTVWKTQAVITDNATNPLTIIRWFDYMYEEVNSLSIARGPEGVRFEKLPDGTYRETQNGRDEAVIASVGSPFYNSMPKFIRPGTKVLPPEGQSPEYMLVDARDAAYEPYLGEMIPDSWADEKLNQQISQLSQQITYYHTQKVVSWITGQANIDAEWDAYIAELERLGINDLLQLRRSLIENS